MEDIKKIQEFFSKPLEENTTDWPKEVPSRHGDIIFRLVKVMPDRAKYELIDAETGKTWEVGGRVYGTVNQLKASAEDTIKPQGGRQSSQFESVGLNEYDVYMPSQEEVDKFFALTHNETHYLNSKPVMGQEGTSNLMPIEPWDEYDFSNWKALVRKAKAKGKSLDEAKVDYDFSERELIRVLRQLKRGASTEVDMIKAFTKALGRDLTKDELFSESIAKINEATEEDKIDIITMDVPLFIRILEYSREDAQEDMDLHELTEKAIKATKQQGILQMDDYDMLVGEPNELNEGAVEIMDSYNRILDLLKKESRSLNDDDSYALGLKLRAWFEKNIIKESYDEPFVDPNQPEKKPGQKYDKNRFANLMGRKVVYAGIPGTIVYADENMLKLKDKNGNIRKINYNMFNNQGFIKEVLSNL